LIIIRKPAAGVGARSLTNFVSRASRSIGLKGEVNVLLTSNLEMQRLNRRFRGKNMPTDVLSFRPLVAHEFAGDIAISVEIARQNANGLGQAWADEIKILALHGLLHLAGYDHENDQGMMEREERRLRESLGLPSGLIERNGSNHARTAAPKTPGNERKPEAHRGRQKFRAQRLR